MQTITVLPLSFCMETAEQGEIIHRKYYCWRKASSVRVGIYPEMVEQTSSQNCAPLRQSRKTRSDNMFHIMVSCTYFSKGGQR